MRQKLFLPFLLIIFFSCSNPQNELSDKEKQSIKETIEKLATESLKTWEPPFNEEKFLEYFTQKDDFSFAVDGFRITNYNDWVAVVYESMDYDKKTIKNMKMSLQISKQK